MAHKAAPLVSQEIITSRRSTLLQRKPHIRGASPVFSSQKCTLFSGLSFPYPCFSFFLVFLFSCLSFFSFFFFFFFPFFLFFLVHLFPFFPCFVSLFLSFLVSFLFSVFPFFLFLSFFFIFSFSFSFLGCSHSDFFWDPLLHDFL